jgi:hypothetical protein
MYWNRSAADIAAAWQAEIESKLETGSTALLLGGAPANLTTNVSTLLGLQNITVQRNDVAIPLLVAGGNSALWLGLLLPPQPTGSGPSAPSPTIVYGGADEATYIAIVALTTTLVSQPIATPGAAKAVTPLEMGMNFAPRLQPGVAAAWETLPFVEVGEQPTPSLASAIPDPTTDWVAWGVMLLALCLVLSAMLI